MLVANAKRFVRHQINNVRGKYFGTHYTIEDALRFNTFKRKYPENELIQSGYKALGMTPADLFDDLKVYSTAAVETPSKTMQDVDGNIVNRTLDNVTLDAAVTGRLMNWISDTAGFPAFEELYKIERVTAWRNFGFDEKKNAEIFSNRYHLDADPQTMVKLFIHMSDVDENCGPFRYMDLKDTKNVLSGSFQYRARQSQKDTDQLDTISNKATGPRGLAFLAMTSRLLHRASVPTPGSTRDMLQIEFRRRD